AFIAGQNLSAGGGLRDHRTKFLHQKMDPGPHLLTPSSSAVLLHLPDEFQHSIPSEKPSRGTSKLNKPETENSMQTTPLLRGDK
ncbi:hypothetical protein P7K49_029128, partial [Saguinus oedipus]